MDKIGRLLGGQRGFTLLEMATVTAIMAALAAIVAVAVTGTAADARTSSKAGDVKNVDTAAARYESDNASFPYLSSLSVPTVAVAGNGSSGVVKVIIQTSKNDFGTGTLPVDSGDNDGVVTCSDNSTTTISYSLNKCFAAIDFSLLVPDYMKNLPQHAAEDAAETGQTDIAFDDDLSTVDASFDNCTQNGETCEIYFADEGQLTGSTPFTLPSSNLLVWNVDSNNNVVIMKANADYGQ